MDGNRAAGLITARLGAGGVLYATAPGLGRAGVAACRSTRTESTTDSPLP
ncbi:hypothetical protein Airi01_037920 [Actinoallomurus iriomotensis]|uniref:Uncharacterized protein n=1 Tax=Actinoallomurus iriomotensis TaxID=478107 RepID=A0A9W6RIP3_9ACTN|nr:hypothetical protein Airi01_037920 [Actinoallomurus iriomotensis]